METIICMIRHGETDWNNLRLIQGRLNNPLNDRGRKQAQEVANTLQKFDPHWDLIISSPLDRAKETAQIINDTLSISNQINVMPSIIEREFGKAEGMTINDEIYDKINANSVEGLEHSVVLQKRAYDAIMEIASKWHGKKILVVTHSHFIKGFFTKISNQYTFTSIFKNTSLNYVYIDNMKVIKLIDNKMF